MIEKRKEIATSARLRCNGTVKSFAVAEERALGAVTLKTRNSDESLDVLTRMAKFARMRFAQGRGKGVYFKGDKD